MQHAFEMQDMLLSPQDGQLRVPPQPSPMVPHSSDRAVQSTESGMEPVPWHCPAARRGCWPNGKQSASKAARTLQHRLIAVAQSQLVDWPMLARAAHRYPRRCRRA